VRCIFLINLFLGERWPKRFRTLLKVVWRLVSISEEWLILVNGVLGDIAHFGEWSLRKV